MWDAVDAADVVVHAGDWVDVAALDELERRSRRLVGVLGNNDHGALRERLPEVARVELEGLRFAVVHETGRPWGGRPVRGPVPRRRRARLRAQPHPVGHHDGVGLRLLNPGSPTDRRRQPYCTYLTAVVDAGSPTSCCTGCRARA